MNLLMRLRRACYTSAPSRQLEMLDKCEAEMCQLPKVVCLCGSTRFKDTFIETQMAETLKGHIVLTVGCFSHAGDDIGDKKEMLDELHKRKIDLCDEVIVLNVNGYVGKGLKNEIAYAEQLGIHITYYEELP